MNERTIMTKATTALIVTLLSSVVVLLSALGAKAAGPGDEIFEFKVVPSTTQAGGHPNLETLIWMANGETIPYESSCGGCEDPRSVSIDAPAGVIGDPHSTPQCSPSDFAGRTCPIDSQIGIAGISFNAAKPPLNSTFPIPVYNLVPHPGQVGLMGFLAPLINSPVFMIIDSRTESDYGLNIKTVDITHVLGIGVSVIGLKIWGVPADPANDTERMTSREAPLVIPCDSQQVQGSSADDCIPGASSNSPIRAFLSNPTTCGVPLTATAEVLSYDRGVTHAESSFPATTGCDQLSFNPSLFGQPTGTSTDAPSGLEINLNVPQDVGAGVPSSSTIRGTTVTLPEGFSINANAADGKATCSEEQAHLGVRELAAECPEFSKVGTLTVTSSSLPGPLSGAIYLNEEKPGDRYRLLLVADGFGLHVKLPGSVRPDPQTGRVTTSFQDLPQFPFSNFNMHFFGSERGILATPEQCGTYAVKSTFKPWNSALSEQTSTQFFTLDTGPDGGPCPSTPRSFTPGFQAGVSDKTAGVHAPFSLELTRKDGDQNLSRLSVTTPPGFSAALRGVSYCPESAIARVANSSYSGLAERESPACPTDSQVGTTIAGAGAGSRPVYIPGKVFLAGPYKGAPLSILTVVPALSGPYDLGNIAVRSAVDIDPITARVTTTTDPLPQIVENIPLRVRSIMVSLDRPGFTLNPTNCDPFVVQATASGDEGGSANLFNRFQVANCADLPYGPKLSLKFSGGVRRRGHPAIHAVFTAKPGESNTRRVSVTLPKGGLLDNGHINTICTRVAFAAKSCPNGSKIGSAEAITPLLDQPLRGDVYLRSSSNKLPDMVMDLRGQVDLELSARLDSVGGRLRTVIESAPDAPLTSFTLDLQGGKKGLLQNSENLCGTTKSATTRMVGQNGRRAARDIRLEIACQPRQKRGKRHLRYARKAG